MIDDFIKQYNLTSVEFNHDAYVNQCVDLVQCYEHYMGFPITSGNAKAQFKEWDGYELIANSPTAVPQKGDIIIWGMAPYGHIAVFVEGDANSFRSFDQNWPTDLRCRIVNHTYKNVLGWLHPVKGNSMSYDLFQQNGQEEIYERHSDYSLIHLTPEDYKTQYPNPKVNFVDDINSVGHIIPQTVEVPKIVETVKTVEIKVPVEVPIDITTEEEKTAFIAEYAKNNPPIVKTEYVTRDITWGEILINIWNKIKNTKAGE